MVIYKAEQLFQCRRSSGVCGPYTILIAARKRIETHVLIFNLVYLSFVQKCSIWGLVKSDLFFYLENINIFFQFSLSWNKFINSQNAQINGQA